MILRVSILYSWFVRTVMFFFPDYPFIMRFRGFLYSLMMDSCGKNFQVSSSVIFNSLSGLNVGENVYMAYQSVFIVKSLVVEDNVIFGPNCLVSGGNHQFDGSSFRDLPSISEKVIIKEGSWIAGNCTILSGTIFPAKSILAAGAVLTKSHVKEHSVYGGIPAKFLKNHFQN